MESNQVTETNKEPNIEATKAKDPENEIQDVNPQDPPEKNQGIVDDSDKPESAKNR